LSLKAEILHTQALALDPGDPKRVYAGADGKLFVSNDKGRTWSALEAFAPPLSPGRNLIVIHSILVSAYDGGIYVPIGGANNTNPGVYRSIDQGRSWTFHPFGISQPFLIFWDMEEDPQTGYLFISSEIGDHPNPYNPPFLKSTDRGATWINLSDHFPWHAIKIQIDSDNHFVYALTEGSGLYRSPVLVDDWQRLSNSFWLTLLIDPKFPNVVFGGNHTYRSSGGGVYFSDDGGLNFEMVGLEEKIVGSLATNGAGTRLYAACFEDGIYVKNLK
jgi:photosystem II stability/assembly factor-like uncharacterized protein